MPKPIFNNRINYQNINGRAIQHDLYLNQNVRNTGSPTFANLRITGNTTLEGNLYVEGNTTVLDTIVTEFKDNILLINDSETGNGVTLNQSGIEISRGILENYRIVYDESSTFLKAGVISNLLPITLRENTPLNKGIMVWDETTHQIKSQNHTDIDIVFKSTTNSINVSTGSISICGGLGITKDTFIGGKIYLIGNNSTNYSTVYTDQSNNSLTLNSVQDIYLSPNNLTVQLPFNKSMSFGSNNNSISANNLNELNINSDGDLNLTPSLGHRVNIPNQTPLVFSTITATEKIYTDSSNNMIIASSQDINLSPGNGKKILVPTDVLVSFGTNTQNISSNVSNDLNINANNNISLNPGNTLDVKIPTDANLKFGNSGNQRITANSNNELFIKSSNTLHFNVTNINVPSNVPINFNSTSQNISGDTNGNINLNTNNSFNINSVVEIINTINSVSVSTGALIINGGLGVKKDINCKGNINSNSLNVSNNTFVVQNSGNGKVIVTAGDSSNNSVEINSNSTTDASKLISLQSNFDTLGNYTIGRGNSSLNTGRILTINLPSYSDYSNTGNRSKFSITSNNNNTELFSVESDTGKITSFGSFGISNTQEAVNATTASLVIYGGLGIVKNIYTNGEYTGKISSINAFVIKDATDNTIFNIDSITDTVTVNSNMYISTNDTNAFNISNKFNIDTINHNLTTLLTVSITSTTDSTDSSTGSLNVKGGLGIIKTLNVGGTANFNNGLNMMNTRITNLSTPSSSQDAATKAYVDLINRGLVVKDSVNVATTTSGNLTTNFVTGTVIDGYTLILGDRILIKNQTNGIENGIYNITNSTPTRTLDLQNDTRASGIYLFVKGGTVNGGSGFICNNTATNDIVNIDSLNFTEFTGINNITPGIALSKIFNTLDVNVDNVSIETDFFNNLRIKNTIAGTGITGGSGSPLQTNIDQSHVTKIGILSAGTWRANTIAVSYGGTGQIFFTGGNLLFGNDTSPLATDSLLFWNNTSKFLGLGTNTPSSNLHIVNNSTTNLLIESISSNAQIQLKHSSVDSFIGISKNVDDYAVGTNIDSLVISTNKTIAFATNNFVRMTANSSGNIGINTSNVTFKLDINGTLHSNDTVYFDNNKSSDNTTTGTLLVKGGVSIDCTSNSVNNNNGGSLTVGGGASFLKDIYVGGSLNVTGNNSNFNNLTLISTENSTSNSTGSLIASGGVYIKSTANASSSFGGSLTVNGGVCIKKNVYIGDTLNALNDTFLNNLYFTSTTFANYIQSPNISRTTNSFLPINFGLYNNQSLNIFTLTNNAAIINNNNTLKIGGTTGSTDGYNINFSTNNLNIIPNNTFGNINFGTVGNLTDLTLFGTNSTLYWESKDNNLHLDKSSIKFTNNTTINFVVSTNTSSSLLISSSTNGTLNIGKGAGQLTLILSNKDETSNVNFTPNTTSSSLILTNVVSTFKDTVNLYNDINLSGNALHQTLTNNTSNREWCYIGLINDNVDGYCEIDFNNGVENSLDTSGLKIIVSISGTNLSASHNHYGNLLFDSINKPVVYIYNDTFNKYNIFVRLAQNSVTNINVTTQKHTRFLLNREGINSTPNGSVSNFTSFWTISYKTDSISTLKYTFGDTTFESLLNINDNLPIVGYNNNNTTSSRDIGTLYQRFQVSNDSGTGDIVNDAYSFVDTLPSQTGTSSIQIKFSNSSNNTDNYYVGWWIKVISGTNINQTRKIIAYNGSNRVATLNSAFTSQNPILGDTVNFYNNGYIVNYYNEASDSFVLGYTNTKSTTIALNDYANLAAKRIYCSDTTPSNGTTSGSIYTLGGITINCTTDATNCSVGGSLTSNGGCSISKNLFVGMNIGIGETSFTSTEAIHIKKTNATVRLQSDSGNSNYVDFVENSNNNRFGILTKNNVLSLTHNTSGNTPDNSFSSIAISNIGYVGINTTTNINSPLTINKDNFISTNSSNGFLGIVGANTNTNSSNFASRIILNSNNNSGSLNLYSGGTSGNVSIFTNNDLERLRVNSDGGVNIYSTSGSLNSSSGSLTVNGGISIKSSINATSFSAGGGLTIAGGASIAKNMYLGGDLYISGNVVSPNTVTSPTITFSDTTNCSFVEYYNNNLVTIGSSGIFSFALAVTPNLGSTSSEIQFTLPGRTNVFAKRGELIVNCSGYTDDTNVIPLFNVISVGVTGTTKALLKFQSVSTSIHYFTIHCTYILA